MRTPRRLSPVIAWLVSLGIIAAVSVTGQGAAHAAVYPLWHKAVGSGYPVGINTFDTVNFGGGVAPTGYLVFNLYGPDDPTCAGAPIFTSYTAVNGSGYYESGRYMTTVAGTYRWVAAYTGDANNAAPPATVCGDPYGQVMVAKRSPMFRASAAWASPASVDTAVLSSGVGPSGPTGTVTFKAFGPDNPTCAGAPAFTTTRAVTGNGSYPSASFSPLLSGTYQWVASYSGDANNYARSTICSDATNRFTTSVATTPTLDTILGVSPAAIARGGAVTVDWSDIAAPTGTDWVALYPVGTGDGGPVAAWRYTTGTASGSVTLQFPWGAPAGIYEARLMANNSIRRLATSPAITYVW
jgi:hypothetical protein